MLWISLFSLCIVFGGTALLYGGPVLEIKNKAGKSISAELLAFDGERVKMRKSATKGAFFIPLDKLDSESVALIKDEAAKLPVVLPTIEIDVSVKTRRKREDDSWYMKAMTVGAKVSIKNRDMKHEFPASTCRVVFIGQDQMTPEKFQVLATRDFDFSVSAGASFELELDEFETKYDSDNKGQGNIGGYKYTGYLLMIHDKEGNLLNHKTVDAKISRATSNNPDILKKFRTIRTGTTLTGDMTP